VSALCEPLPFDYWITGDEGNRLAMGICRRCTGCPDNDPRPHGVIRRGVAYSDAGKVLPICPNCGQPNVGYRGGEAGLCSTCAVPDIAIPSAGGDRLSRIARMVEEKLTDTQIGADLGLKPETVRKLRRTYGIRRQAGPLPVPEVVTA
jgi:hypothetical protein